MEQIKRRPLANWGHGILLKSSAAEHPDRNNIVGPLRDVAAATAGSGTR